MTDQQKIDELQAHVDRLTYTNLAMIQQLKRAEKKMHDWFLGQALAGTAKSPSEAEALVKRALRIADAAMRLRS